MSRKIENILKDLPDVLELHIDEDLLKEKLVKELRFHGIPKVEAIDIAEEIARKFVLLYSSDLFIRRDLTLAKSRLIKETDSLNKRYLETLKKNEELAAKVEDLKRLIEDAIA